MSIFRLFKSLSEKVSDMPKNNKDQIRNIGRNQIKVGWFIHNRLWNRNSLWMTTYMSMTWISDSSELGISFEFVVPFLGVWLGSTAWTGRMLVVFVAGWGDTDCRDREGGGGDGGGGGWSAE